VCRYVVYINGKKAIHEALVGKATLFANRPEFYTLSLMNPHSKGYFYQMCNDS